MGTKKLIRGLVFGISLVAALAPLPAVARILRIIHTNDLHAHLEHATSLKRGGYAAVKAKIDELRAQAVARGEETLVLDAGDFTEGSQYYLQGEGLGPFEVMNKMGYDAVVIGNHDWLMGPSHLDWLLPLANPPFAFLGANFSENPERQFISQYIKPYDVFERNGVRVGVLGLTTNEFYYSWRAKDGDGTGIADPIKTASDILPELKRKADMVIALTHLGVNKDVQLIHKNRGIDLVIGGHSHTCLYAPVWSQDRDDRLIPIVQTGNHGEYVGLTSVDIEPGREPLLLDYQMIPVYAQGPQDPAILEASSEVRKKMLAEYGEDFMQEQVALSSVPLENPSSGQTVWSRVFAEAIREAAGTELSFDMPQFHGDSQPAGPITMEQLFELYPRMFDFEDRYGWNIWKAKLSGWLLDAAIHLFASAGEPTVIGGAEVVTEWDNNGKAHVKSVRVNGKPLNLFKSYTVAFGEGIVRAATEISPALKLIVKKPQNTGKPVWLEVRRYIHDVLQGRIDENSATVDSRGTKRSFTFFKGLKALIKRAPANAETPSIAAVDRDEDPSEVTCEIGPSGAKYYRGF